MTDLERLARILAASDGCDPDVMIYETPLPIDRRGRLMAPETYPPIPTWQTYVHLVRVVLGAVMTGAEGTDMHRMLSEIITEDKQANPEPEVEIIDQVPRHWRDDYGLNRPGVPTTGRERYGLR